MQKIIATLVVLLLIASTAEARWLRRGRTTSTVRVTARYSFTGDAQAVCEQKAALQASLCSMFHPGGSFGGGNCEGVACASDPNVALNSCCYSNSGRTIIGQAVRRGVNGMWYACRIFR